MSNHNKAIVITRLLIIILFFPISGFAKFSPNSQLVDVDIVRDNGHSFPVYPIHSQHLKKEYRAYLQAFRNQNYSLRIQNRSNQRIGIVIAVDGRNIISGKKSHLKHNERMYILGPYETQTYSGWRTSSNDIHRFYFTDADNSYAQAFDDDSAMGVIAMAVFKEHQPKHVKKLYKGNKPFVAGNTRSKSARAPNVAESDASEDAGTGFGNHEHSRVRIVHFNPERNAKVKYFYKYEWKEVLCEKQVIECGKKNRFWPGTDYEIGFAPYPKRSDYYNRNW